MTYSQEYIELAAANNCTPEEYGQAYSDYSDHYKSVHGIRPRWAYGWTLAEFAQGHQTLEAEWASQRANTRQLRIFRKLVAQRRQREQEEQRRLKASILASATSGFSIGELVNI